MPLPDIPVESWIRDQQEQFTNKVGRLFGAFEFDQAGKDQEGTIPHDWPMPGGKDQWEEAERQRLEDEHRKAQQEDEQRRAAERQRMEEYYRGLQQESEQAGARATATAAAAGIPTPDSVSSDFAGAAARGLATDDTATTGALDNFNDNPSAGTLGKIRPDIGSTEAVLGTDQGPRPPADQYRESMDNTSTLMPAKSPADQFGDFASGLISKHFGGQEDTAQAEAPASDNTSSAIWPDLGAAVSNIGADLRSGAEAAGARVGADIRSRAETAGNAITSGVRATNDVLTPVNTSLANALDYGLHNVGMGRDVTVDTRVRELEQEAGKDPLDIRNLGPLEGRDAIAGTSPDWQQQNPEKAQELQDLYEEQRNTTLAMAGMAGAGGGKMAEEAVNAIKALRAAGYSEEVILAAEKNLAEKSPLTLEAIQKLTRGAPAVQSGTPRVGAEEPTPPTLSSSAAEPENVRGVPIEQAVSEGLDRQPMLPGMEEVATREPPPAPRRITGIGELAPETGANEAEILARRRAEYEPGRPRYSEQQLQSDVDVLRQEPGYSQRVIDEANAMDPRELAQRQRTLADEARSPELLDKFGQAQARMREITQEIQTWMRDNHVTDMDKVPAEMIHRSENAALELTAANSALNAATGGSFRHAGALARGLASLRSSTRGAVVLNEAERVAGITNDVKRIAEKVRRAAGSGIVDDDTRKELENLEGQLSSPGNRRAITGTEGEGILRDVSTEQEAAVRRTRRARRTDGGGAEAPPGEGETSGTGVPATPREESLAERFGRLKRELGRLTDPANPDTNPDLIKAKQAEIDDVVSEVRANADERARQLAGKNPNRPVDAEEAERIINDAIGRRAIGRINRQALDEATGRTAIREQGSIQKALEDAIQKKLNDEASLRSSIEQGVNRRIDAALAQERKATVRNEVRDMANDARIMHRALRKAPDDTGLADVLDTHLRAMAEHSNVGENVARELRSQFESNMSEDAFKFLSNVERRNAEAAKRLDQKKLNDEVQQMASDARIMHRALRKAPDDAGLARTLDDHLEAMAEHSMAGEKIATELRSQFEATMGEDAFKLLSNVERRNAEAGRRADQQRLRGEVRDMAGDARIMHNALRKAPNDTGLARMLDEHLQAMADHSPIGDTVSRELRSRFESNLSEDAFKHLSNVERRNADALRAREATAQRTIRDSLIKDTVEQIKQIRANPHAPGSADRLETLYEYLTRLGDVGAAKATNLRKSAYDQGLYKAGMAKKGEDTSAFRQMLANVDPNDPSTLRPLLAVMGKPHLLDYLREISYINMLSSPTTHFVNASSNALMGTGRLLFHNPISQLASGGVNSGTGAAFEGAFGAVPEAYRLMKQTWKTGYNPQRLDRLIASGNLKLQNRELMTEKYGKLGELYHAVSTRPLEAMDAFFGHIMHASAANQMAQQEADKLIRNNAVPGWMLKPGVSPDRELIAQKIMQNIWDFPEVLEKAGKIQDYSLFRGSSTDLGKDRNAIGLLRGAAEKTLAKYIGDTPAGFVMDLLVPFYNIPMNFLHQGLDRTLGPLYTLPKAGVKYYQGDKAAAGDLVARGVIGASTMATAGILAGSDMLTGDGPRDPTQRRNWLNDHRVNSFRLIPNGPWISWEGTPFAIPFSAVANAFEGYHEAQLQGERTPGADPNSTALGAAKGAGQGLVSGLFSQSLMSQVAHNVQILTGQSEGWGSASNFAAGTAARYAPAGIPTGMLNYLGTITDTMERDVGRPRTAEEALYNIGDRLKVRVPGVRESLPERLTEFGQPVPNERSFAVSGPAAAIPNYRGYGPLENDPITKQLASIGYGVPDAPNSIPMGQGQIPLTIAQQREFQRVYGQTFRTILEENGGGRVPLNQRELDYVRSTARQTAARTVVDAIPEEEIQRIWRRTPVLEAVP
jgi:hypothetical protein